MKNFIFAILGFLMMSLVSLDVQASSVTENIPCKSELAAIDVGLTDAQGDAFGGIPADCFTLNIPNAVLLIMDNPIIVCPMKNETAIRGEQISVPKFPFRYIYKSRYITHYSYAALSKQITPY